MDDAQADNRDAIPVLPGDVPVVMPDLPLRRVISTEQELKAIGDRTRSRILGIIQNQPATAKQIADRLGATPGAIGYHLHILEAAGLAQIVARRITRGIVANYYTRTARIFAYDPPNEVISGSLFALDIFTTAREEFVEALASRADDPYCSNSFPHTRLAPERARIYHERLQALVNDILQEQPDPDGEVYGFFVSMFRAPDYLQSTPESPASEAD
jgi:DNA-binding transcriptional ArsR family regulator